MKPLICERGRAGGSHRKDLSSAAEVVGRVPGKCSDAWGSDRVRQSTDFRGAQDRIVNPYFVNAAEEKAAAAQNAADAHRGGRGARAGRANEC